MTVTGVAEDEVYILGAVPTAGCATADPVSGIAEPASLSITGGPTVGSFTATCSGALDVAGNGRTESVRYRVHYDWSGFFSPIQPGFTQRTAGSAVPVKFSLDGNQGLAVLAQGSPSYQRVNCTTRASIGSPAPAAVKAPGSRTTLARAPT